MELVPKIKTKTTSVIDFVGAGVIKSLEEPILAGIVGDGNFVSGAAKMVIAAVLPGQGRLSNMAKMGFGIDAGEDFALALMGLFGGGTTGGAAPATM
ncbi:MAG: hypothetical protein EFT35_07785 [Methanophagales archaeon ANME-1-THS]|nr:MAG: hypothetical protein EFT35_07785 [Methanophagales archaeon ANME-1-THS]